MCRGNEWPLMKAAFPEEVQRSLWNFISTWQLHSKSFSDILRTKQHSIFLWTPEQYYMCVCEQYYTCVCVLKLMKQNFYKYLCISAIFLAPIHFKILIMLLKQPKKYQKTPLLKLDFRSPGFWEGLFSRTKKEIWSTRRGSLLLHQLEKVNPLTNQECK